MLKYLVPTGRQLEKSISPVNKKLMKSFLAHIGSQGRKDKTLAQYKADLITFFKWNASHNDNKDFIDITEEDFLRFREMGYEDLRWSMSRARTVEGALSSMSSFIEKKLCDDEHYKGFKSVIRDCRVKDTEVTFIKPVYTEEELQDVLDMLTEESRHKEACLLALAMYSGRTKRELLKFELSFFQDYGDTLYRTPTKVHTDKGNEIYFYVLKEKFDPYLKLWMEDRKENGIDSKWLFPEYLNNKKPWRREAVESAFADIAKEAEMSMYWTSLSEFAAKEFIKAGIPHDILWEMSGISDDDLVNFYMKG